MGMFLRKLADIPKIIANFASKVLHRLRTNMIESLIIKNVLSFKERTEFNFTASMERPKAGFEHISWYETIGKKKIQKIQFLFGNNGTGKSNFMNAIASVCRLACFRATSKTDESSKLPSYFFKLSEDTIDKPSSFEIIFHTNDTRYKYDIRCSGNTIEFERLTKCPIGKKEVVIFIRNFNSEKDLVEIQYPSKLISLESQNIINDNVIKNTSVVSIYDDKNFIADDLKNVFNYFNRIQYLPRLESIDLPSMLHNRKDGDRLKAVLIGLLSDIGSNIIDYKIEIIEPKLSEHEVLIFKTIFGEDDFKKKFSGGTRKFLTLQFAHPSDGESGKAWLQENEESEGTLNMIRLIIALYDAIVYNTPILIDECASGIHQQTFGRIIQFFLFSSFRAQAFMASQHLSIMEMDGFRRDTLKFFDKNRQTGETSCRDVDLRKYHKNLNILRTYLDNSFGCLPEFPTSEEWMSKLSKYKSILLDTPSVIQEL
jgi:AAA15 family ATPase/GTPase